MPLTKSHGRLGERLAKKKELFYFIIPSTIGVLFGLLFSIPESHSPKPLAHQANIKSELKVDIQSLTEDVRGDLERIRNLSLLLSNQEKIVSNPSILSITHFDVSKTDRYPITKQIKTINWGEKYPTDFENLYLSKIESQIHLQKIQREGLVALPVRDQKNEKNELLALFFLKNENTLKLIVSLIDPALAFKAIYKFGEINKSSQKNAYIISSNGIILSHTNPLYSGTDVSEYRPYQTFLKSQQALSSRSGEIEIPPEYGRYSTIAYKKIGSLPFTLMIEKTATVNAEVLNSSQYPKLNFKKLLILSMVFSSLFIVLQQLLLWVKENFFTHKKTVSLKTRNLNNPPQYSPYHRDISISEELTLPSWLSKEQGQSLAKNFHHQSLSKCSREHTLDGLVKSASTLCDSPVLYFNFHQPSQMAYLKYLSGFKNGTAPDALSFSIPPGIQLKIIRSARNKHAASLSKHPPLVQSFLQHLGVAHFEAWAITTPPSSPRLLGVLVILHAGVQSTTHRQSLIQMMRTTGSVYQNSSQNQPKMPDKQL